MKASRLLSIVLLLQVHGRMTSRQLADRFEVSDRTILRDIESLSTAGIPVYAERGRHGAVVLDTRARLDLTRMDPAEIQLLTAVGLDVDQLKHVGLGDLSSQTQRKLDAATRRSAPSTRALSEVLLIDSTGWFTATCDVDLTALLEAARQKQRIHLVYRHSGHESSSDYRVDPYGLVHKQASWYLVGDINGVPRMFNAARILSYETPGQAAELRAGESLEGVWNDLVSTFVTDANVEVKAQLRTNRLDLASRILGTRLVSASPPADEWVTITVAYSTVESVRQLLQFGDHIQVLAPPEAKTRIRELALDLAAAHSE